MYKKNSTMGVTDHLLHCKSTGETYHTLCDLLTTHKKVYFSRFGDGDIRILMGISQANHDFKEELADEIGQSLSIEHPQFLRGLQINHPVERGMTKGIFEHYRDNDEMENFISTKMKISFDAAFENSVFPNYYSVFKPDEMSLFLDRFIRPRKKMFIGSVPESEVRRLYGEIHSYIQTPRKNAYSEIGTWWPKVLKDIDSVELVLPAAGMATRVISKRLWNMNKELHVLDLGSIVDAVSSFAPSRKWIKLKGHKLNRILLPEYRDHSPSFWFRFMWKETGFFIRYQFYRLDPFSYLRVFRNATRLRPKKLSGS